MFWDKNHRKKSMDVPSSDIPVMDLPSPSRATFTEEEIVAKDAMARGGAECSDGQEDVDAGPSGSEVVVVDAIVLSPGENAADNDAEEQSTPKKVLSKKTPSRPLCAADLLSPVASPTPAPIVAEDEQTAFSAIAQEEMDNDEQEEIKDDKEDKENAAPGEALKAVPSLVAAEDIAPAAAPRAATAPAHAPVPAAAAAPRTSSLYAPTKSMLEKQRKSASITSASAPSSKPRGPTVAVAPTFRTEARSAMHGGGARPLTSEERELQAVAASRQAMEERRQRLQRAHCNKPRKAFQSQIKNAKVTVPAAPCSHLTRRLGEKASVVVAAGPEAKAKADAGAAAADFVNRRPTQPVPFTFATDARLKGPPTAGAANAAPTVAEAAERFMRDARSHGAPAHVPGRRTEAHPPTLRTDQRAKADYRPKVQGRAANAANINTGPPTHPLHPPTPKPLSTEEKEVQEFAALQSNAFKAKPVDRRIFDSMGELGVPKVRRLVGTGLAWGRLLTTRRPPLAPLPPLTPQVPARAATEPEPFDLRIDKRATVRPPPPPDAAAAAAGPTPFKARPVPDAVHHAPPPPPQPEPKQLTVPKSPNLSGPHAAAAPAHRQLPHHSVLEQERHKAKVAAAALPSPAKTSLTEPKVPLQSPSSPN